jgi:hypothetical protein
MSIKLLLLGICGFFWSLSYLEMIRIGIKEKTYAMPFVALSLNFTWEIYNSINAYLQFGPHLSTIISCLWVLFDVGIVYTYFRYGAKELSVSKFKFYLLSTLFFGISLVFQHAMILLAGPLLGAGYAGFLINLVMSLLFIRMFYRRADLQGQNLFIALTKCIGTIAITVLVGAVGIVRLGGSVPSIFVIGIVTLFIDFWYCLLVNSRRLELKKNGTT